VIGSRQCGWMVIEHSVAEPGTNSWRRFGPKRVFNSGGKTQVWTVANPKAHVHARVLLEELSIGSPRIGINSRVAIS
jgi:hypothetical protein